PARGVKHAVAVEVEARLALADADEVDAVAVEIEHHRLAGDVHLDAGAVGERLAARGRVALDVRGMDGDGHLDGAGHPVAGPGLGGREVETGGVDPVATARLHG